MSSTLADAIEQHILELIAQSGAAEVQRIELSRRCGCAPSQINYVLATRFGLQRGFVIESRRGGGGYIRIRRAEPPEVGTLAQAIGASPMGVSQQEAETIIATLRGTGRLTEREAAMLLATCRREVLAFEVPQRDLLRARILSASLWSLVRAGE